MFTPETVIQNRYRIVQSLENAPGEVYEAFDETQQQPVTVQVWAIHEPSTLERLQHATNARRKSNHPALPKIIDHFVDGSHYVLVTEWIAGPTLAERLTVQGKPFTPAEVLQWAEPLVEALIVLHRQIPVLAHGDIRAGTVKENPASGITLLETNLYAVGGTNAPTEEEDIYDTCALMYHLLTGVTPPAMAGRTARGFLPSADMLNPAVPASFGTLLAQGMSENHEDRFKSAYALQNALKRIQEKLNENETVVAPPPRSTPLLAAKLQQRQSPVPTGTDHPVDGTPALPVDTPGGTLLPAEISSLETGHLGEPAALSVDVEPTESFEEVRAPLDSAVDESRSDEPTPLFTDIPPPATPNLSADPFKLSLGENEPTETADTERPADPPPISESPPGSPPPTPPNNQNRLWFALGIGCIGAILCICCSLIGIVVNQFDAIMAELEAADITIPEPDAEADPDPNPETPFDPDSDTEVSPDTDNENSDGLTVSVFDIKVGDCYQDPEASDFVTELTVVDCDAPHDNEIYAFGLYPADDNADFPSEAELDEFSDEFCTESFEEYVGIPYADSIYYITYLQPTEESWGDGDREVVCILYDRDGPMEGSKQDSQE